MDFDLRTGQVVERLAQALLYASEDKREGTEAFLSERPPQFTGGLSTAHKGRSRQG